MPTLQKIISRLTILSHNIRTADVDLFRITTTERLSYYDSTWLIPLWWTYHPLKQGCKNTRFSVPTNSRNHHLDESMYPPAAMVNYGRSTLTHFKYHVHHERLFLGDFVRSNYSQKNLFSKKIVSQKVPFQSKSLLLSAYTLLLISAGMVP